MSEQNGAANLMHQTNRDGVQARVVLSPTTPPEKPTLMELLLRCCCCHHAGDVAAGSIRATSSVRRGVLEGTPLLQEIIPEDKGKLCLVLDLDETLVHSSFKPVPNPDYVIPVDIEGTIHHIYVLKRPGVDEFLEEVGKLFEVVVYTASLNKYADPLLDWLDKKKVIRYRLFREQCTYHEGTYVKDLARLGRELKHTIIIDNSPASYLFHPENAIGISTYIDDPNDRELFYCLEFLKTIYSKESVYDDLTTYPSFILKQAEDYQKQNS